MMIELIRTKSGSFKIISRQSHRHPALVELAQAAAASNQYSPVKIGVYNVTGGWLSNKVSVFSYISQKSERMGKTQYRKFLEGKRQIVGDKIRVEIPAEDVLA